MELQHLLQVTRQMSTKINKSSLFKRNIHKIMKKWRNGDFYWNKICGFKSKFGNNLICGSLFTGTYVDQSTQSTTIMNLILGIKVLLGFFVKIQTLKTKLSHKSHWTLFSWINIFEGLFFGLQKLDQTLDLVDGNTSTNHDINYDFQSYLWSIFLEYINSWNYWGRKKKRWKILYDFFKNWYSNLFKIHLSICTYSIFIFTVSMFNIVRFPNDACDVGDKNGTCYTK